MTKKKQILTFGDLDSISLIPGLVLLLSKPYFFLRERVCYTLHAHAQGDSRKAWGRGDGGEEEGKGKNILIHPFCVAFTHHTSHAMYTSPTGCYGCSSACTVTVHLAIFVLFFSLSKERPGYTQAHPCMHMRKR